MEGHFLWQLDHQGDSIFARNLVERVPITDLAFVDHLGYTALHCAVIAGNIEAAKLLVNRNPNLPNIWSNQMWLPLHLAAAVPGNREMFLYLLKVTKADIEPKPFEDDSGVRLLSGLITNEFYGEYFFHPENLISNQTSFR
ncbi:unnamed protein product [Ilex paraguariensis]|uniref:Uncharacterized protein n=1 Tax=Ilex paraguariensis TaxID=185542 RepID=A0ABC8UP93_9AQUA